MADKFLNDCAGPNPLDGVPNLDPVNPLCDPCKTEPSLNDVPFSREAGQRERFGRAANSDPMQAGRIVEDFSKAPNRNVVYRYSQAKRGCDEAVKNLFEDLVVIDEVGSAHPVPIIWATHERAVAAIVQDNVRKDNSSVIERIRLPMMAIYDSDLSISPERYTYHGVVDHLRRRREDLHPGFTQRERYDRDTIFGVARGVPLDIGYTLFAWTLYKEDMNQILEQVVTKFSPIAYINVLGVYWETIVKLESIANNENVEPGGTNLRFIKWQFNLRAETYIPMPLRREKAVLKTRVNVVDGVDEEEISRIIARLEEAADELKND